MQDYERRLKISIQGNSSTRFFTKSELHIATGYLRIVLGGRGPYIELDESQIIKSSIYIEDDQKWRLDSATAFYNEYRTNDYYFVKIYERKKLVDYADYKIGLWYISPFDLLTDEGIIIKREKE